MLPQADEAEIQKITATLFQRMKLELWEVEETVRFLSALIGEINLSFVRGNDRMDRFLSLSTPEAIDKIRESRHAVSAQCVLTEYLMQICSYFQMQKQGKGATWY